MKKKIIQLICLALVLAVVFAAAPVNLSVSAATFTTPAMIAGGGEYSVALKSDGTVWTWGRNNYGQLGIGIADSGRTIPVPVAPVFFQNNKIQAIAAGDSHVAALTENGSVYAWGRNTSRQLGNGEAAEFRSTPVLISELSGIQAIAAGGTHTVALKNNGTVLTLGGGSDGQLGNGTTQGTQPTPVQVQSLTNVKAIAAGYYFTVALKNDGTVLTWGSNVYGQLGNGTKTGSSVPIAVINDVKAIAAGGGHTVALKTDGTVWAWGRNNYGQLGDETTTDRLSPVQVKISGVPLNNVKAIAACNANTIALKNDGTVWIWGSNANGQLGYGIPGNLLAYIATPLQLSTQSNIYAVAVGGDHAIAIKNDGVVWAWGNNGYGQVGNNSTTTQNAPVKARGTDPDNTFNVFGIPPTAVTLVPTEKSLDAGKTFTIAPTVFPSNATHQLLTWISSDTGVASVDSGGKVSAKAPGTAIITAKTINNLTATCTVKVTGSLPTSVKLSPTEKDLIVGGSVTIKATISPSNATNKTVTWSSSKSSVASVSSAGKVTAKAPGTATITAKTSNGKTATCKVTVHQYVSLRIGYTKAIQNGVKTTIDAEGTKPILIDGRTMLPLRFVGEKMGATVKYVNATTPITVLYGAKTVKITLGSKKMTVTENGKTTTITLDVPAQVKGAKTYLPLRAIGEALGFDVFYDSNTKIIVVNSPKMTPAIKTERLNEAKAYIK